ISKIRCLAARKEPQVGIEVHLAESHGQEKSPSGNMPLQSNRRAGVTDSRMSFMRKFGKAIH
ncbi:MAG: hypothetical protein LWX55_12380, partial [Deltaproteobacteria bacterium]|nr:hypothetical protein [Deltaproteobacteria bacterium]